MVFNDRGDASLLGRSRGRWPGSNPRIKNLCVLSFLLVVLIGLMNTTYLDVYFQGLKEGRNSVPIRPSFIDTATSDRWLKASGEDNGDAGSSGDFVQEASTNGRQQTKDMRPDFVGVKGARLPGDASSAVHHPRPEPLKSIALEEIQEHWTRVTLPAEESAVTTSLATAVQENDQDDARLELPKETNQKPKERPRITLSSASSESPDDTTFESRNIAPRSSSSNLTSSQGHCDLTAGKWVEDRGRPLYSHDKCKVLSQHQNCQQNGRPDNGYEFYKWEPDQCTIPRMDPVAFLELMQGKTLAFVGDSLARNQMESLLCILLQAADAQRKSSKNVHRWFFPSHKFTVIRIWSSWLAKTKGEFPPSSAPADAIKLNLTEIDDEFAYHLPKFDVTILSSGHWWVRKTAYFLKGEMLGGMGWPWPSSLGVKILDHKEAFRIALSSTLERVGTYPGYKGLTILRTFTPDHYTGGSWDTGGSCTGETKPYDKGPMNSYNEMMYETQIRAFENNTKRGDIMPNGSKLKMLDVYPILNYRGDGHPGPFRSADPLKRTTRDAEGRPPPQDCLHWCMPGPMDSMNELLFHILREELQ